MSITDELRKIADTLVKNHMQGGEIKSLKHGLIGCADRIDAAHDKALNSVDGAYDSGYNVGYDKGFASADDWLAQHEDAMAEHGWVRMPEGADGKYWFCGDKIVLPDGNVVEIIGIGGDWLYYCMASVAMTVFGRIRAHDKRHYHVPTVEDVLIDMHRKLSDVSELYDVDSDELEDEYTRIIAEYAAKLLLADGKEQ